MASTATKEKVNDALGILGLEVTEENCAQLQVLVEAMFIYEEREKVRDALWKAAGAEDCAHNLKHKSLRMAHASDEDAMAVAVDDALDAVNYAAFYARNVRAGRLVEEKEDLE